jgi:HSP20 family molecular chaperone IbpA
MRDRLIGEWEKDHEKKYFAVDLARHGVTPEDVTISADGLVVEIDGEKKTIKLR